MLNFLTPRLKSALRYLNANKLCELRVRANYPVTVNYGGRYYFLSENGLKNSPERGIVVCGEEIAGMVYEASSKSVYAVSEEMKRGFITAEGGVRIGICGKYVCEDGKIVAVRDFTSLCIRIPHEVRGCADEVISECFRDGISSVLVISPPGGGKTTILKEMAAFLSSKDMLNVLICDERGELYRFGEGADVISYAEKRTAFTIGIRTMRSDVIVTDELTEEDYIYVKRAMESGVKIMASAHLKGREELKEDIFDYYVVLDGRTPGKIDGIYKGGLSCSD